ncbi:hypothetical protein F5884DRAFT_658441 [Xylogone sp. PMI_703]|nr:hypothetical protein F5884DRAFT_658441 [Xylogone sp. PMI_703]
MATPQPDPELKTYEGSCHCGAFKYHVNIPDITQNEVGACNCSICFRKNYVFVAPSPGNFVVDEGEGSLVEYRFGEKKWAHKARTLHDIDIWPLKQHKYNGAATSPQFTPHKFTGELPTHDFGENTKLYTGGCHCGAVTVAFKTDGPIPTSKERVMECDCSICMRNGSTRCYPLRMQYSVSDPTSALVGYAFGPKNGDHKFCKHCGVPIYIGRLKSMVPQDVFDSWPPEKQYRWDNQVPVNLRVLEGVEWDALEKGLEEGKQAGEGGIGRWRGSLIGRGGKRAWE